MERPSPSGSLPFGLWWTLAEGIIVPYSRPKFRPGRHFGRSEIVYFRVK